MRKWRLLLLLPLLLRLLFLLSLLRPDITEMVDWALKTNYLLSRLLFALM